MATDYDFWETVKVLGWGVKKDGPGKTTKPEQVKKVLMKLWTRAQAKRGFAEFLDLRAELALRLIPTRVMRSDDSFHDLMAHIIGLGEAEYMAVLECPQLAWDREEADQYEESFAYCFPDDDDYDMLTPKPFIAWAKRIVRAYEKGLKDDRYEPVHDVMRGVIDTMVPVLEGRPLEVLPSEPAIRLAMKTLARRRGWIYRGALHDGEAPEYESADLVLNLFHDIREFLG